jgi:uncharacterized membrane protein
VGKPRHHLDRWVAAGLLDPDQAAAIAEHETADDRTQRRGVTAEAIGYVGAALALGAVGLLVADAWPRFTVGGRIALSSLLTVVAAGAGAAVARADATAMRRLGGLLLAAAALGAAWVTALVASDVLDWETAPLVIVVGSAAAVLASVCLVAVPSFPLQLVGLAGLQTVACGLLLLPRLTPNAAWFGLVAWSVAIVWALLGRAGVVRPPVAATVLGGAAALLALQFGAFGDGRTALLLLGVVTAATWVGLAVGDGRWTDLVVGGVGLFVFVPQVVFELFGDAIGAPATLLVVGLLLVLVATGLGRARREVPRGSGRSDGASGGRGDDAGGATGGVGPLGGDRDQPAAPGSTR